MVDFRHSDARKMLLQRLRSPTAPIDFGYVRYDDRIEFTKFLVENGIMRADMDYPIYYTDANGIRKSKFIIDVYLPIYIATIPFIMSNDQDPKERCKWQKSELVILDFDMKFWWADNDELKLRNMQEFYGVHKSGL